jgi:hypothetical protein
LDTSATFRENGRPNPTKDNKLQLSFILQYQFRAYKNPNPKEKQQKAIPACVIAKIAKQQLTELQCAILQLTILAFFFVMHSCKYIKSHNRKQQTKILSLQNLYSKMVGLSTTTIPPSNTPTASLSHSKCKK